MVIDENRSIIAIQDPKSTKIQNDVDDRVKDVNIP